MDAWRGQTKRARPVVAAMAVAVAVTMLAGPGRAAHVEAGLGTVPGGIAGGLISSTIGSGQELAVGVGSALGALYGRAASGHHPHSPVRGSHEYAHIGAKHHRHPHPPAIHHQNQPVAVYVTPTHVSPPSPAGTVSLNITSHVGPPLERSAPATVTECRQLEDGLSPVYACRDTSGSWRILR